MIVPPPFSMSACTSVKDAPLSAFRPVIDEGEVGKKEIVLQHSLGSTETC
jgi:hypothetical protein